MGVSILKKVSTIILCQDLKNLVETEFGGKVCFYQKLDRMGQKWCLYFTTNPLSGKILVLELWAKMLLASQTAGFFKMSQEKE